MSKKQKEVYVVNEIEQAMLKLLKDKELVEISITQITAQAQVSRSSFYRNYTSKEEIITRLIQRKLLEWQQDYNNNPNVEISNPYVAMWRSLFNFLRLDKEFYKMIEHRNLFHLVEYSIESIIMIDNDEPDNIIFFSAFVTYGLYGWIKTWIKNGMGNEHSESIVRLLKQLS
ncbi:TetR/AcrR family transcriptional regulator [Mammaliicoccus sciuri]|uniref:TetR/AcrR family transcriptional regulator n=1 Tax=Mammaliicoccus sciuri TaxID=1296 RepID=UPI000E69C7E1|nr:TetR/AcrR family transcriptional regulator [Mammaliicoccus sciuri]MBO3080989.1 TetR/AcrR family transcriptional regulator [Mammaliicoccus sciuri]MEB6232755.1 TetR/AcrR family transcriptional regulator [Mammaliicoccus sciuri]RIN95173.1 TetR/AcrR family transcriptional regulator [Mammaliicoccus sciuri]